ncbi:DUF1810 domain-containing protein [Jannaschia sp. Os4]|uniref:DUF1810 family protein n=1 Tax=Jannaschia sp. Os4 TaxID=2807617 RepID=UPI001939D703|nr:DUF1810 domain-containing protein [Jannaschia sp. Os4]
MSDLARFHAAQEGAWETALAELEAGRKRTHWMWFVFPQLRGLGRSDMAWRYGIDGADEARAYLADPVLRDRLARGATALLRHADGDLDAILGTVDALKLRSSMTLFETVDPDGPWGAVLAAFGGARCSHTQDRLA